MSVAARQDAATSHSGAMVRNSNAVSGPWAPKLTSGTYQAGHKLPAERFLEERDGQFALRLQRGLIQLIEQLEQRVHAA